MLPPMLTARPGPQTLLLSALTLLIAAATIMLACGPVAQPIPDAGDTFAAAPQTEDGGEEPDAEPEEPTATPTPTPELDCLQAPNLPGGEVCIELPPTKSPPKYPALGDLSKYAEAAEEAQSAAGASGASGASGQSGGDMQTVYVRIALADKASTEALISWLENNRVTWFSDRSESDVGRIRMSGDDYIYAYVPASLLVSLSQREGVTRLDDGCHTSFLC